MRIISLEPFITDLVNYFEAGDKLVAVSAGCHDPLIQAGAGTGQVMRYEGQPTGSSFDWSQLQGTSPTHVIGAVNERVEGGGLAAERLQKAICAHLPDIRCTIYSYCTLESLYVMFEELATELGAAAKGRSLAQRLKAQTADWCNHFFSRSRNKKVVVIRSADPLEVGGGWVADLCQLATGVQSNWGATPSFETSFEELAQYKPDVLVVAPEGLDLKQSIALLSQFEKDASWEKLPAVKRGEVVFGSGLGGLFSPSNKLLDGVALLISAIAGLESGYITPRDSYYRLRWLELHRHKLKELG